jgi:hypothetical protein
VILKQLEEMSYFLPKTASFPQLILKIASHYGNSPWEDGNNLFFLFPALQLQH